MTYKVGRLSRALDAGSLLLVIAGGALYMRAYVGMHQLKSLPDVPFARDQVIAFAALTEFARLHRYSTIGLIVASAGVALGVWAAAHAHRLRRSAAQEPSIS
jgi:hypothetical protein